MTIHDCAFARAPALSIEEERAHLHAFRRRAEASLETILQLLDELDGDPDLEPSLATTAVEENLGIYAAPALDDCEEDHECEPGDDNGIADVDGAAEQGFDRWHGVVA